jgi:hypothetical protein
MTMIRRLTRVQKATFGIAGLMGIALLTRTAMAFNPQPDPPRFGMVGIADGQTARLNLVNLGNGPESPPDPCRAHLQFFDASGNVLAGQRLTVKPGESAFLDYVASFLPINTTDAAGVVNRAEIRPAVNTETGAIPPPCRLTVEIFDNATGRTSVFFAPPCRLRCGSPTQP